MEKPPMDQDPVYALARHVTRATLADIPASARESANTFILDTVGVGISGRNGPMAAQLAEAVTAMGDGQQARVWGSGRALPAAQAALCNAYQAHCQEYDCVHEAAVAHVLTIVLPAALATAERSGKVTGATILEAVILGVDVAASLGVAATSGLRFFRPGTAGAFGGAAAAGKVLGLNENQMVEAFSLVYGQLGGTMQAHTEGSGLLALQMGFNARNAVFAADLAAAGFTGPHNILFGDFGYFRLIEDGGDPKALTEGLGNVWRITEVAHKPYPSGRATHGILDGCLALQREHGFEAHGVAQIKLRVPPLIEHLVGRPAKTEMAINYARLCARYVLACALHGRGVALNDFTPKAYRREGHQALAAKVEMIVDSDQDPNALTPIRIEIRLNSGEVLERMVTHVYGSPENPMTHAAHLDKFRANCALGERPLPTAQIEELIRLVASLEEVEDVTALVDATIA